MSATAIGNVGAPQSRTPVAQSSDLAYRGDIDGLRALAVLGVVAYHAFPGLAPGGFSGVDIFFVISGFLISGIILRKLTVDSFSFADFYAHRIRRIFPALIIVLIVSWVVGWRLLAPSDFIDFARSQLGGVGFFANFSAAREDYFHALGAENLLLHLWSLGIEEQFYLVWPVALWAVWRWWRGALPIVIALVILLSFADSAWRVQVDLVKAFYYPDSRMWELGIGGALSYVSIFGTRNWGRWQDALSWSGALALCASLFVLNGRLAWPAWWALIPVIGTAFVLAAGPDAVINNRVFATRPMIAIGKISYPWYLWHWPLLVAGRMVGWSLPQGVIDGAAVVISLALATVTYIFVERPIRFRLTGSIRTWGPAVAMLVPAALAGVVFAYKGVPQRFPVELRTIFASRDLMRSDERKYGYASCFAGTNSIVRLNVENCIDPKSSRADRRPLAFVWGDSHAFALFSGLKAMQRTQENFRLALFAKGSCPFFAVPGRTWSSGGCAEFNDDVKTQIRRLKPDVVLVDAFWANPQYLVNGAFDEQSVQGALGWLRAQKIEKIVVVGTVPVWLFAQPTIIARLWRKNAGTIPQYTFEGLNASTFSADVDARRAVAGTGAVYLPLVDKLCGKAGCLLMANAQVPMQFDGWHLTPAGSARVAKFLLPTFLHDVNTKQ